MVNLQKEKNPMPEQAPDIRNKNFDEVALGYSAEQAVSEAQRCLNCKAKPCVQGCPVRIKIPDFISKIASGDFEAAYRIINEDSSLPAVCGRVCPQESQCESFCARGRNGESVAIGRLERFAADYHAEHCEELPARPLFNGHRVAVVGSGPSGLACAGELARRGYEVTIFEALHKAGGVLIYGIPEFRLPKSIVSREIKNLEALGVTIRTDVVIGRSITLGELMDDEGYEAVFIGSGAGLPMFMNIPGESLKGVYSANEFLTRITLMKAYMAGSATPVMHPRRAAVIGGGNVAMDAARSARRLGAEHVYIIYRRSEAELPARAEELCHAKQEGIEFVFLAAPVEIIGTKGQEDRSKNGFVRGIRCIRMRLTEPDAGGRRRPVPIEGSEFELEVDVVIMALGTTPNPQIGRTSPGLDTDGKGRIITAEGSHATGLAGVYAGGDAVTGAATVILAMGAGKQAAAEIDEYLT